MRSFFGQFSSLGWRIAGFLAVVATIGGHAVVQAQQHVFSPVGPTGALDTNWAGGPNFAGPFNLGNAPTGTWTSAFVAIDYAGSSAAADQWSNEARVALHSQAWDNFLNLPGNAASGPANAGTVYWAATSAASNSTGSIAARPDLYWSVTTLSNAIVSDGSQAVYLSSRQTYGGGGASATHANIRVVLNPNIVQGLGNGLTLPSTFTDMGTFAVGNTSVDVNINNTQTGADGISWLRFQVNQDVTADNAFDLFTRPGANGATDPRITLFRNTASGLFAVASTDDMAGTVQAGLTFGSSDTTGFDRDQYGALGNAGFFNGRGGTLALPALNPFGYYSGVAGNGRLLAGEEYFLAVSHWSGTAPFVTTVGGLEITDDEVRLGTLNMGLGNPSTALGDGNVVLSFRSVPEPGSMAFVAIAGASVLFRRRRRD